MYITPEAMFETAYEPDLSRYRPEVRLLAAVLVRTIRDVFDSDPWIRQSAIEWLNDHETTSLPDAISYKDVQEFVDLGALLVKGIDEVVLGKRIRIKHKHIRACG